jgi:hypothetical protein
MKQRKRMQQLQRRAGIHHLRILRVTTRAYKPPMAKRRAQSLAPSQDQPANFIDRCTQVTVKGRPALALCGQQVP